MCRKREGSVILPTHPLDQYLIVDTVSVGSVCYWLRKLLVCLFEHVSAIHKLPTGPSIYSHAGSAAVSPDVDLTCRTRTHCLLICFVWAAVRKDTETLVFVRKRKCFLFFFYSGRDQQHPLSFYMQYINKSNTF